MEFKEKQYDGPYEISEVEIENEGQIFRGLLYFPPESFKKPHPLVIYFHDFPQLFTLKEIVRNYQYLLEQGFAFLVFNLRGYRYSEGTISIESQTSDSLKLMEFVRAMSEHGHFDLNDINIFAQGFGSYIALILCSQTKIINKLLLLCPILDLEKHVYSEKFLKSLQYINRFLPGNIHGIEDVNLFITNTKLELKKKEFRIYNFIKFVKCNRLKIILGESDKITPLSEVKQIFKNLPKMVDLVIIPKMDHECIDEDDNIAINEKIKLFFIE
ncbi:MAG: alpha/beta hydrolase family protein [Candidatus Hermodarchaeota archaeon]